MFKNSKKIVCINTMFVNLKIVQKFLAPYVVTTCVGALGFVGGPIYLWLFCTFRLFGPVTSCHDSSMVLFVLRLGVCCVCGRLVPQAKTELTLLLLVVTKTKMCIDNTAKHQIISQSSQNK